MYVSLFFAINSFGGFLSGIIDNDKNGRLSMTNTCSSTVAFVSESYRTKDCIFH